MFATLAVVVVVDVDPEAKLTILPVFNVPVTPASFASEQPSPSESKSSSFGIPSLSKSQFLLITP